MKQLAFALTVVVTMNASSSVVAGVLDCDSSVLARNVNTDLWSELDAVNVSDGTDVPIREAPPPSLSKSSAVSVNDSYISEVSEERSRYSRSSKPHVNHHLFVAKENQDSWRKKTFGHR